MNAKILIVDDSSLARRTVKTTLEAMGHIVDEATDGAQALERFYVHHPDLVLLDMVMNGMYGLEVLAKMRELNPDARVVIVTADIQQSTQDQARAAGASGFITKPLSRPKLSEVVSKVLAGGQSWS